MKRLGLGVLLALSVFGVVADNSIPIPELSGVEVIEIAEQYLVSDNQLMDIEEARPEDYLLMSVHYKSLGTNWGWVVQFRHPEYRTHAVTYMIGNDGMVSTVMSDEQR